MKALPILLLPLLGLPAAAQSIVPGPNQPGRYEMQPIDGGVARLDTVTGDVSLCRVEDGTLRCRPSEDEDAAAATDRRSALGDDDDRTDRDFAPRAEERGDAEADRDRAPAARADADADIDKAIRRMKKLFHAFGDIARDWDGERGPDRGDTGPDRT